MVELKTIGNVFLAIGARDARDVEYDILIMARNIRNGDPVILLKSEYDIDPNAKEMILDIAKNFGDEEEKRIEKLLQYRMELMKKMTTW